MQLLHVDLFSGIGGFSLAFEAEGFRTVVFCESDPARQRDLRHHWPGVPIVEDVNDVDTIVNHVHHAVNMLKNYEEAVAMYKKGLSIQTCADYYGITRQAMWKILMRRGVKFRSQQKFGTDNHFHRAEQNASKRATHMVEIAVRNGTLTSRPCEICGSIKSLAHHDDYNKPLSVRWLCKKHHFEWHKHNKAIALTTELPKMSHKEICSMGGKASAKAKKGGQISRHRPPVVLTAGVPC